MNNSILSITVREQAVLDFVRAATVRAGRPPVWDEVWGKFGFTSPGGAYFFLRDLERRGMLILGQDRERGIVLIWRETAGDEALSPAEAGMVR